MTAGDWKMGNQPGKAGGPKAGKAVYEVEKKSRTGWQPGIIV